MDFLIGGGVCSGCINSNRCRIKGIGVNHRLRRGTGGSRDGKRSGRKMGRSTRRTRISGSIWYADRSDKGSYSRRRRHINLRNKRVRRIMNRSSIRKNIFMKTDIPGNKNSFGGEMHNFVTFNPNRITQKDTLGCSWIKFSPIVREGGSIA